MPVFSPSLPNYYIAALPLRMVHVGAQDNSEDLRLYISKGQKSSYAALSYCWGGSQSMMLSTSNVDSLTQQIDRSKLPQTLEDAIKSVCRLGLRFIWIDALCIMQDSPSDMDLEIVKMEQYYENACVTIAAASTSTCSRGFLERRPEDDLPFSKIRYPCPDGSIDCINVLRGTNYNARLGRGLVFDDEIAAQQRMHIQRNFGSGRGSEVAGNFGKAGA